MQEMPCTQATVQETCEGKKGPFCLDLVVMVIQGRPFEDDT